MGMKFRRTVDVSTRPGAEPARFPALASLAERVNASMQDEDSWRAVWAHDLAARARERER